MLSTLALAFVLNDGHSLIAQPPLAVPGGSGHFDFMSIDPVNRLVFACHPGKSSIAVVDLETNMVKDVSIGVGVNGAGADPKGRRVFAAGAGNTLVRLDSKTWERTGALALGGPGDCVQFDAKRRVVYVDNDDGTKVWIVDPDTMRVKSTVTIKEAPEYMEIDDKLGKIYQAIKSTSTVQVIDLATSSVVAEWTLGTVTSPHGLAVDRRLDRVFVAGRNGKLAILDARTGHLMEILDIVKGSDQIAYDEGLHRLYVPGESQIQIIQVDAKEARVVGSTPVAADCHRIAIDPRTHSVWVAYTDSANSYFQRFTVK